MIVECIDRITAFQVTQTEIDNMYDSFCFVYYNEMNQKFRSINILPGSKKRFKKSIKPFWNDNLQSLWNNLCKIEKKFLSSPQGTNIRRTNLISFRVAQRYIQKSKT